MKTALGYTLSVLEWHEGFIPIPHLRAYEHVPSGLRVVEIDAPVEHEDGRRWYHVSCSYRDHIPSYDDLLRMARAFCKGRTALQIFPPEEKHISGHGLGPLGNPNVLHLWVCIDDDLGLPDFGKYGHI